MGLRHPVGRCLKLQVNFRTRATNYRALLRKMTSTDQESYGSFPPFREMPFWEILTASAGAAKCSVISRRVALKAVEFAPCDMKERGNGTRFKTLQHPVRHCNTLLELAMECKSTITLQHIATHCNTLQHTATHCNTLQHTATPCITMGCKSSAAHCNTLRHIATHRNILQHTATQYTLQHTTTHRNTL